MPTEHTVNSVCSVNTYRELEYAVNSDAVNLYMIDQDEQQYVIDREHDEYDPSVSPATIRDPVALTANGNRIDQHHRSSGLLVPLRVVRVDRRAPPPAPSGAPTSRCSQPGPGSPRRAPLQAPRLGRAAPRRSCKLQLLDLYWYGCARTPANHRIRVLLVVAADRPGLGGPGHGRVARGGGSC
jgi:hypothetical protein